MASGDGAGVVEDLLLLGGDSGWGVGADVELGDGNVNVESGESVHVLDLGSSGWGLADDEVGLETNTVDLDTLSLDGLDQVLGRGGLVAWVLDVVVVVIELDLKVVGLDGGLGGAESGEKVVGTGDVVPDVLTVGTVVVEGLVHNVPRVAVVTEVGNGLGDVVLKSGQETSLVPVGVGQPGWVLVVPVEVVAANDLVVLLGQSDELVTTGEVEDTLLWLNKLPLHDVGWGHSAKVMLVGELGKVVWVSALASTWVVDGGSHVDLAGGLGGILHTAGASGSGSKGNAWVGVGAGGGCGGGGWSRGGAAGRAGNRGSAGASGGASGGAVRAAVGAGVRGRVRGRVRARVGGRWAGRDGLSKSDGLGVVLVVPTPVRSGGGQRRGCDKAESERTDRHVEDVTVVCRSECEVAKD